MDAEVIEPKARVEAKKTNTDAPVFDAVIAPPVDASQRGVKYASPFVLVAVVAAFYYSYSTMFKPEVLPVDSLSKPISIEGFTSIQATQEAAEHKVGVAKLKERFKTRHTMPFREPSPLYVMSVESGAAWDDETMWWESGADVVGSAALMVEKNSERHVNTVLPPRDVETQRVLAKTTQELVTVKATLEAVNTQKVAQETLIEAQKQAIARQHEEIERLRTQLNDMEHRSVDAQHVQEKLALVVAVNAEKPYKEALAHATWLTQEQHDALLPFAHHGLPKHEVLEQMLAKAIEVWLVRPMPEQAGVWRKTWHNVTGLVQIRKVGEDQAGGDDEARLARAEAKLKQKKYQDVLNEINLLSSDSRVILEDFRVMLMQYVVAKKQLEILQGESR